MQAAGLTSSTIINGKLVQGGATILIYLYRGILSRKLEEGVNQYSVENYQSVMDTVEDFVLANIVDLINLRLN